MQSPISRTPNKFAILPANTTIAAGEINYTYFDKEGNLYMAGKDAIYKGPTGPKGSKCMGAFTPEELGRIKDFEQFLYGLLRSDEEDLEELMPLGTSLLALTAKEVLNSIEKEREDLGIKVPMDRYYNRTDLDVLSSTGIDYGKDGNDIHSNWVKHYREENTKGVDFLSPGAQQIRAYVTAHFPFMQHCRAFVGQGFGHEAEIFFGEDTETKISKIPTKIYMDSKVVNISQNGNLIGALTEDGIAHIWEWKTSNTSPAKPENLTIGLVKNIGSDKYKAIKVVILDYDEYAVIMDDGNISMNSHGEPVYFGNNAKYVDIMGSYTGYYALTTSGVIEGMAIKNRRNVLTVFTLITLPEPIKELSARGGSYAALSKSGNIYIWGRITTSINSTMVKYKEVVGANSGNEFPVYKVNLPQPISSIYMTYFTFRPRLMAVSIYGKLYSLQGDKMGEPTEINIGGYVKYVADGKSFTVAVSPDGVINYWDHK